jgi:hypothetical protein
VKLAHLKALSLLTTLLVPLPIVWRRRRERWSGIGILAAASAVAVIGVWAATSLGEGLRGGHWSAQQDQGAVASDGGAGGGGDLAP